MIEEHSNVLKLMYHCGISHGQFQFPAVQHRLPQRKYQLPYTMLNAKCIYCNSTSPSVWSTNTVLAKTPTIDELMCKRHQLSLWHVVRDMRVGIAGQYLNLKEYTNEYKKFYWRFHYKKRCKWTDNLANVLKLQAIHIAELVSTHVNRNQVHLNMDHLVRQIQNLLWRVPSLAIISIACFTKHIQRINFESKARQKTAWVYVSCLISSHIPFQMIVRFDNPESIKGLK